MDCKFCGKPISKHNTGRETDACVDLAMRGHIGQESAWYWSTNQGLSAVIWEALPKLKSITEFDDYVKVIFYGYLVRHDIIDGYSAVAPEYKLGLCQAVLSWAVISARYSKPAEKF